MKRTGTKAPIARTLGLLPLILAVAGITLCGAGVLAPRHAFASPIGSGGLVAADVSSSPNQPMPAKDNWDKVNAISGLLSGVLVAAVGAIATYVYRRRQKAAEEAHNRQQLLVSQVQTLALFKDELQSGDNRAVELALLAIAALGNVELSGKLADVYRTPGSVEAMRKLSSSPDPGVAHQGHRSLQIVESGIESEARRKLRLICEGAKDPADRIEEHILASGPDYGHNVLQTELEFMIKEGWVVVADGWVTITDEGRREVCARHPSPGATPSEQEQ